MERNVKISLEKAREWYNSDNKSLKEVALQAFEESELIVNPWENIKTFEDACKALDINPKIVDLIFDHHLQNMYKLQIVRKALNVGWEPKLNEGIIYYPLIKYIPKGIIYESPWKTIANFRDKEDNKVYTLFGGEYSCYNGGLGNFGYGGSDIRPILGLLGCKSREIAKYFSITFGKLIFDAIYGQYNNYTWI